MPHLTLREWVEIQADIYAQVKAIKDAERKRASARRR